uniref:Uncharacterized protein n=1 Tax=Nocardia farcinica TaxID=37329 RepID=A0A449G5Q6_NOCFR
MFVKRPFSEHPPILVAAALNSQVGCSETRSKTGAGRTVVEHVSETREGFRWHCGSGAGQHEQAGDRTQHDDLDPICVKVSRRRSPGRSGRRRPGLQAALAYLRPGDLLTVQEPTGSAVTCSRPARAQRSVPAGHLGEDPVRSAAVEHTERNLILDMALALAEEPAPRHRPQDPQRLEAAARRGKKAPASGGRRRQARAILARHAEGQSLREISRGVGVSLLSCTPKCRRPSSLSGRIPHARRQQVRRAAACGNSVIGVGILDERHDRDDELTGLGARPTGLPEFMAGRAPEPSR